MSSFKIILASASPRRSDLLRRIGLEAQVIPSGLSEDIIYGEAPSSTVARLAEAKGEHIAAGLGKCTEPTVVLSADTAVVLDSSVLGKPGDDAEANEMLRTLSGREHEVITGIHLARIDEDRRTGAVETTRVRFRELDEDTIRWYISTGEPRDKAGAYGIQGYGVLLTTAINGSWSNVVGLPLERLPDLFLEIDLDMIR